MNCLRTFNGANPHLGLGSVLLFAAALLFKGCLSGNIVDDAGEDSCHSTTASMCADDANLVLRFTVQNDLNIPLQSLKFRFTSNLNDTVLASQAIATLAPDSARIIEKSFTFAPLRWWNLQVQALDSAGVVRALGHAGPFAAKGGVGTDSLIVTLESFQESVIEDHSALQ